MTNFYKTKNTSYSLLEIPNFDAKLDCNFLFDYPLFAISFFYPIFSFF